MTAYLHSIYNGGNNYFSIDVWVEEENCFYPIPYYDHLNGSLELSIVYEMAKKIGIKKLVLDF